MPVRTVYCLTFSAFCYLLRKGERVASCYRASSLEKTLSLANITHFDTLKKCITFHQLPPLMHSLPRVFLLLYMPELSQLLSNKEFLFGTAHCAKGLLHYPTPFQRLHVIGTINTWYV